MWPHDATEAAYKNGFEAGKLEGISLVFKSVGFTFFTREEVEKMDRYTFCENAYNINASMRLWDKLEDKQ